MQDHISKKEIMPLKVVFIIEKVFKAFPKKIKTIIRLILCRFLPFHQTHL